MQVNRFALLKRTASTAVWLSASREVAPVIRPKRLRRLPSRLGMPLMLALMVVGLAWQTFQLAPACVASTVGHCSLPPTLASSADLVALTATPTPPPPTLLPAYPFQPLTHNDFPPSVAHFLTLALPLALQAHHALGWPTSVILAQWGLEHTWTIPDANGWNWGNIELIPGCVPAAGGSSRFCYARTLEEGLSEYLLVARLPFYVGVSQAAAAGADATALALGRSPWDARHYTSNGYPGSSLLWLLRTYNLYRFDNLT